MVQGRNGYEVRRDVRFIYGVESSFHLAAFETNVETSGNEMRRHMTSFLLSDFSSAALPITITIGFKIHVDNFFRCLVGVMNEVWKKSSPFVRTECKKSPFSVIGVSLAFDISCRTIMHAL